MANYRRITQGQNRRFRPFQVIGVDFAGWITYKIKEKNQSKAYVILFCESLFRMLYLEIIKNQALMYFLKSLKRFLVSLGHSKKTYSDNSLTFVAPANWLQKVFKGERFPLLQLQFCSSLILAKHHVQETYLNG